jgi:hypothetical protein
MVCIELIDSRELPFFFLKMVEIGQVIATVGTGVRLWLISLKRTNQRANPVHGR